MSKYLELFSSSNTKELTEEYLKSSEILQKRIIYELISSTMTSSVSYDTFVSIFEALCSGSQCEAISSFLVEILWLNGLMLQNENNEKEIKSFSYIVNYLLNIKKVVALDALMEKLEETTLIQCGIVNDMSSFRNHITRVSTKMNYEQQKFNLLREESEGFAKLIFLLFQFDNAASNDINKFVDGSVCLIGFFDLDPIRVVDIVLESFKASPYNDNYLEYFKVLDNKALPHLIGFKLKEEKEKENFYIVIAKLISHGFVSLVDILAQLTPGVDEMEGLFKENRDSLLKFCEEELQGKIANELRAISYGSLEESNPSHTSANPNFFNNFKSANHFVNFDEIIQTAKKDYQENQVLLLYEGFIRIKDKKNTLAMFKLFKNCYDVFYNPTLSFVLCDLFSWMISPLLPNTQEKGSSQSRDFEMKESEDKFHQISSVQELMSTIEEILPIFSLSLSVNQIAFQKFLLVLNSNILIIMKSIELKKKLFSLFLSLILPTFSLIDPVPQLVSQLWNLMCNLSYQERYSIYNKWLSIYSIHPYLYIKYQCVYREIGKWQKSLSKENQRQHGRILAVISTPNPVLVFDNIIKLLTSYENQINFFISSLSFCSLLSYDVISFIICRILADPRRPKIDQQLCEISVWFKNFSYFIGCFYKKFYHIEIAGVLNYIIAKFKKDEGVELYVLKELIEKMSGIQTQEFTSENNQFCECGGLAFYLDNFGLGKEMKYFKKPAQVLMKYFSSENQITLSLLILLAIKKNKIIYATNSNLRLMSFKYDLISYIQNQLKTFLRMYSEKEIFYKNLLANFEIRKFMEDYKMTPSSIFSILRNSLVPLYLQSEEEYKKSIDLFKFVFDHCNECRIKIFKDEFEPSYIQKEVLVNDGYKKIWNFISPEMYYIFFALELSDLYFPEEKYDLEIQKLMKEKEKFLVTNEEGQIENNPGSNLNSSKARKEAEKIQIQIETYIKEKNKFQTHQLKLYEFIKKKNILIEITRNKGDLPRFFIQYLLYPRLLQSKNDAIYSVKFLQFLISLNNSNINVLDIIQKISKYILRSVYCVTEYESYNIGIFLTEFLKEVTKWTDKPYWNENCQNNPSFSRKLELVAYIKLEDFKEAIGCILKGMSSAFKEIFINSEEYMNIRNAINVLRNIPFIPPNEESAIELIGAIDISYKKFEKKHKDAVLIKRYKDKLRTTVYLNPVGTNEARPNDDDRNNSNAIELENDKSGDKKKKRKSRSRSRTRERDEGREKKKDKRKEEGRNEGRNKESRKRR